MSDYSVRARFTIDDIYQIIAALDDRAARDREPWMRLLSKRYAEMILKTKASDRAADGRGEGEG